MADDRLDVFDQWFKERLRRTHWFRKFYRRRVAAGKCTRLTCRNPSAMILTVWKGKTVRLKQASRCWPHILERQGEWRDHKDYR